MMGNYEQLKSAIAAVIKTNGNNEITGALLQQVLIGMTSQIGANMTFKGVATPATQPATPDQNCFYMATERGTYSNFDGQELDGTKLAIFFNSSGAWRSWLMPIVDFTFDNTPTEDSTNPVTSDGIFKALMQHDDIIFFADVNGTKYEVEYVWNPRVQDWDELMSDTPLEINAGKIYIDHISFDMFTSPYVGAWIQLNALQASTYSGTIMTEQTAIAPTGTISKTASGVTKTYDLPAESGTLARKEEALPNKTYAPAEFSGLGRKYLQKNIVDVSGTNKNVLTQAMFQDGSGNALTNTIFVIQYDYDLNGQSITIPAGCTLQFDGGSISNGTIVGNDTRVANTDGGNIGSFIKAGTWSKDYIRPFNISFDYVIETQADFEDMFTKIADNTASTINVLLRNNTFVSPLQESARTITGKNISIYGDNATLMAHNVVLENYVAHRDGDYTYYDVSDIGTGITGNDALLDDALNYVPFNCISFVSEEYPAITDTTNKVARIKLGDDQAFLKNKTADYFKYSYLRFSSCWCDSKAEVLYSDSDYLYFNYLVDEFPYYYDFNINYHNAYYGSPTIRLYNIADIFGVYLSSDNVLRVPNNIRFPRLVTSPSMVSFNNCASVNLYGLKFAGTSPYSDEFENYYDTGALFFNNNSSTALTIKNCECVGICSSFIMGASQVFSTIVIDNCHFVVNWTVGRNLATNGDFVVSNNKIEGVASSFSVSFGLINAIHGDIDIHDNVFMNAGYNSITSTEYSTSRIDEHRGKIYSNHIYCTDEFLNDSAHFFCEDGGGIYIAHRSDNTFEVYDNVVHDVTVPVGIYLDGGSSNVLTTQNLVYNTRLAINVNGEENIKNTDIAGNINLTIIRNIIGDKCMINSQTSSNNGCTFSNNVYLSTIFNGTPFNSSTRPLNFDNEASNLVVRSWIGKAGVTLADNFNSGGGTGIARTNLVSKFLHRAESPTRPIRFTKSCFTNINAVGLAYISEGSYYLKFTINSIVAMSDISYMFDIAVPTYFSSIRVVKDKSGVRACEICPSPSTSAIYMNAVDGDAYTTTFEVDYGKRILPDWTVTEGLCKIYIENVLISTLPSGNGASKPIECSALYFSLPQGTNTTAIDRTQTNLLTKTNVFMGASNRRLTAIEIGGNYYDTTIHKPTWYDGTNGWKEADGAVAGVLRSGATADRPASSSIYTGFQYWDTTLGKMIAWNGSAWVNLDGTALS